MSYKTLHQLPRGADAWCSFDWVDLENQTISMRAPLFDTRDDQQRVLVDRNRDGVIRVFCEDTEHARRPVPLPGEIVQFVIVPTISVNDLMDTIDWEEGR